jgi:hypothetical protein
MTYLFLTAAILVFLLLIKLLRIERLVGDATMTARHAGATMASKTLDDDEKEMLVQAASLRMLRFFGLITLASIVALGLSVGVALLGVLIGFYDAERLLLASVDWRFLLGATVATIGGYWLMR